MNLLAISLASAAALTLTALALAFLAFLLGFAAGAVSIGAVYRDRLRKSGFIIDGEDIIPVPGVAPSPGDNGAGMLIQ